jgi:hypothetical protein
LRPPMRKTLFELSTVAAAPQRWPFMYSSMLTPLSMVA